MLSNLLRDRIERERMTVREASRAAGVSHTTIARILEGLNVDVPTMVKLSNWLGVSPASVINSEGVGEDALAAKIAALIEVEPALANMLTGVLENYEQGILTSADVKDIIEYASFKIQSRRAVKR